MHLDISHNTLSDEALKSFSELIAKFDGFRSINMTSVRPRMNRKDTCYVELAKAIKENRSIVELDMRDNDILETSIQRLFDSLRYNYVLTELKVDLKSRRMPSAFSCYALQSMYEFSLSIEEILLTSMITTESCP